MRELVGILPLAAFLTLLDPVDYSLEAITKADHVAAPERNHILFAAPIWGPRYRLGPRLKCARATQMTLGLRNPCWSIANVAGVVVLSSDRTRVQDTLSAARSGEPEVTRDLDITALSRLYFAGDYRTRSGNYCPSLQRQRRRKLDGMTYHLARVQHGYRMLRLASTQPIIPARLFDLPVEIRLFCSFSCLLAVIISLTSSSGLVQLVPVSELLSLPGDWERNLLGQGAAMIVAATTPMLILQSSSPENHLVTSFWIVCAIYFALTIVHRPRLVDVYALGIALGLAMLTKGTAYVFAVPILGASGSAGDRSTRPNSHSCWSWEAS